MLSSHESQDLGSDLGIDTEVTCLRSVVLMVRDFQDLGLGDDIEVACLQSFALKLRGILDREVGG